ncbi:TLC domain-containing protein [Fragilaria crotonensis]|nr:TLC domain-containing protein [Fragilaria crotonensis]
MGTKVITASTPSGVARMKLPMLLEFFGLTVIYNGAALLIKDSKLAIPAEKYCPEENPLCVRPDLFAFQVACFAALAYCGIVGFHTWHISKRAHTAIPQTPEGRIFGYLPESENSQQLFYISVFFLGLSEFSSIFLVFVSLAKYFPPAPGSLMDVWVAICGPCFALTFTVYRVVLWWKVVSQLWSDASYVLKKGLMHTLRPGKTYVLYLLLALSIPMGLLQLYWLAPLQWHL